MIAITILIVSLLFLNSAVKRISGDHCDKDWKNNSNGEPVYRHWNDKRTNKLAFKSFRTITFYARYLVYRFRNK